jgi:hypothetical protein
LSALTGLAACSAQAPRHLRDVIADAIRRREIRGRDPDVLTAMVMGLVLQTAPHKIYGRIRAPLADMADVLAVFGLPPQ